MFAVGSERRALLVLTSSFCDGVEVEYTQDVSSDSPSRLFKKIQYGYYPTRYVSTFSVDCG